jgi:hypothetical protein
MCRLCLIDGLLDVYGILADVVTCYNLTKTSKGFCHLGVVQKLCEIDRANLR